MKKDPNHYPKGWNKKRVQGVIAHYTKQSDADAIAEADAAWINSRFSLVRVPVEYTAQVEAFVQSLRSRPAKRRKTA